MSRFSGKCDLYDMIEICGGYEKFAERYPNIFIGDLMHKLSHNSLSDLAPYYAYIDTLSGGGRMILSHKSWVDIEEERYGKMQMHEIYRNNLHEEIKKITAERDNNV